METENKCKQTLTRIWEGTCRIVKTRLFAAGVMGAFTVALAVGVAAGSRAVTVTDGSDSRVVLTLHSDPYRVLSNAGVSLEENDALRVNPTAGTIDVARAMTVTVEADGVTTLLHVTGGTVADALEKAEVTVGKYDTLSADRELPLADEMNITVDRVAYEEYTVKEVIDYETEVLMTPNLKPGKTRVAISGEEGARTVTYRKTIVNGEVVETEVVSEKITKQPVTKKLLKGSDYGVPLSKAPGGIELDKNGQPVHYKRKITGSCTAYSTKGPNPRGASGMKLGVGTVAVDPREIPYGTKLWITSADGKFVYGYAVAADTGSFIYDEVRNIQADLFFRNYREACAFGRRTLNIYVIG